MRFELSSQATRWTLRLIIWVVTIISIACQKPQTTAPDAPMRVRASVKRSLGSFRPVTGSSYLMAPIESETDGEYSAKGSTRDVHNYVFFNTADESVHTLMPTNDYWIVERISFPEAIDRNKESESVQWCLYSIVKQDTDGDKALTYKDHRTLAISDVTGTGFTELISDVEEMYGQAIRESRTLFVLYRSKSKKNVAKIDLPNRKVISTKEQGLEFSDLE